MVILDCCEVDFVLVGEDYLVMFNDFDFWSVVYWIGEKLVGEGNFNLCDFMFGGEDFVYYGVYVLICFVVLGCGNYVKGCIFGFYYFEFKVDEDVLYFGMVLYLVFVLDSLGVIVG